MTKWRNFKRLTINLMGVTYDQAYLCTAQFRLFLIPNYSKFAGTPNEQTVGLELMKKKLTLIFLLEYKHRALPPYCISSPKPGNEQPNWNLPTPRWGTFLAPAPPPLSFFFFPLKVKVSSRLRLLTLHSLILCCDVLQTSKHLPRRKSLVHRFSPASFFIFYFVFVSFAFSMKSKIQFESKDLLCMLFRLFCSFQGQRKKESVYFIKDQSPCVSFDAAFALKLTHDLKIHE